MFYYPVNLWFMMPKSLSWAKYHVSRLFSNVEHIFKTLLNESCRVWKTYRHSLTSHFRNKSIARDDIFKSMIWGTKQLNQMLTCHLQDNSCANTQFSNNVVSRHDIWKNEGGGNLFNRNRPHPLCLIHFFSDFGHIKINYNWIYNMNIWHSVNP